MLQNTLSFFLQLCLATLAFAAPVANEAVSVAGHGDAWQYGTGGGIIGFIVLILDILVFSKSMASSPTPPLFPPQDTMLTASSGSTEVEPSPHPEGPLVPRRLPLPHPRHGRLLALLQPGGPQERLWLV
jgi:hypothetical protein